VKKSKIDLVEDNISQRFEIRPEFAIHIESWGLLTRVCLPRPVRLAPLRSVRVKAHRNIGPIVSKKYRPETKAEV
jgi:hypothetical protein